MYVRAEKNGSGARRIILLYYKDFLLACFLGRAMGPRGTISLNEDLLRVRASLTCDTSNLGLSGRPLYSGRLVNPYENIL